LAKFATFLTVCIFIVNGVLLWLRDGVKIRFPTVPQQIGFHIVLSVAVVVIVSFGNALYIWFFRGEMLDRKVTSVWTERMSAIFVSHATFEEFEGPLGRLAQLCINASRPNAVLEATKRVHSDTQNRVQALSAQIESQRARLADYEKSAVPNIALHLANHWRLKSVMPRAQPISIDDPVYGRIYLDEELATVLSHPILQRLNRVKQLSFSYARFPSATHTRLAHSLGVAKNAELALSGIIDRGVCYRTDSDAPRALEPQIFERRVEHIRKAKLAALLHDIGHGPFGHALDNYTIAKDSQAANSAPDKMYGTDYILEYLSPTLESLGFDPAVISNILGLDTSGLTGIDSLISEIIDSPLDADRMDYLIRDADMTGLKMGFTNTMALLDFMRPLEDRGVLFLTFDEAAISYIEHFLYAREAMYTNCYEEPGKMAAERLFSRVVALAIAEKLMKKEDLLLLTDEEIIAVLKQVAGSTECSNLLGELTSSLRYQVVHEVDPLDKAAPPNVRHFAQAYGDGDDLELVYVTLPNHWETRIAERTIGTARSYQIQVLVPSQKANLQRHSQVRILSSSHEGSFKIEKLFNRSKVMQNVLRDLNPLRVKIRVACPLG
jgi:HD superfamily phosphohydrolase